MCFCLLHVHPIKPTKQEKGMNTLIYIYIQFLLPNTIQFQVLHTEQLSQTYVLLIVYLSCTCQPFCHINISASVKSYSVMIILQFTNDREEINRTLKYKKNGVVFHIVYFRTFFSFTLPFLFLFVSYSCFLFFQCFPFYPFPRNVVLLFNLK